MQYGAVGPSSASVGRRAAGVVTVVGSGWLGTAFSRAPYTRVVARRSRELQLERLSPVVVASGRSSVRAREGVGRAVGEELTHLRRVLDACERAEAPRIVVLGSSDVAGVAPEVRGRTPQAPLTPYAQVKAALEDECVLRASAGLPVTCVRLAPVHGQGKARSASLVRLARRPVVPLPGGGSHSIGFVLLDDALAAIAHLTRQPAPAVVSVGGGPTPLRALLDELARAQGGRPRWLPLPAPAPALRRLARLPMPEPLHWLVRLSLPRSVAMEVPVPVTPLPRAAAMLVASC